jgi:hypothetical protein
MLTIEARRRDKKLNIEEVLLTKVGLNVNPTKI